MLGRVAMTLLVAVVAWFVWLLAGVAAVLSCSWAFGLDVSDQSMNAVAWTTATIGALTAVVLYWRD